MIKTNFVNFLAEASGNVTARQGHANEFFTNDHGNVYGEAVQKALSSGASDEQAHAIGLQTLMSTQYDHKKYSSDKKTQKSVNTLGRAASKLVHDNSRNTAAAAAEYMFRKYGGKIKKSIWVGAGQAKAAEKETGGKKTNADVILKIDHNNAEKSAEAHLEQEPINFGGSLKYSSDEKDTNSKIHSPGVNTFAKLVDDHHRQMYGKGANLQRALELAREEGQQNQRRSVLDPNKKAKRSHHEVITDFLKKARANPEKYSGGDSEWEKSLSKAKYEPVVMRGKVKGADFNDDFLSLIRKTVRKKPKNINHEALSEFYDHVSSKNSEMRNGLADILHPAIKRILSRTSNIPEEQEAYNKIKESLHRHLANVFDPSEKPDQLPTLMIKTGGDGTVGLTDLNEAYKNHFSGQQRNQNVSFQKKSANTGTFRVGPGTVSIDVRPGTMHNPLTNPVNYTVPSTFVRDSTIKYKNGKFDQDIIPHQSKATSVAPKPKAKKVSPQPTPSSTYDSSHGGKKWSPL